MNYVADTHALLWWFTNGPQIGSRAAEVFERCENGECCIFIPSIVIAEALSIFDKKRISFDFKALFGAIHESDNFFIVSLDYEILREMVALKEIEELHDKIIVSTAKHLNLPIITKDQIIRASQIVETIW
jgi:PIN domain nuclease of toxin-antitoxin system